MIDDARRDLPRRAVRRGPLHLRRRRCAAGARYGVSARSACSGTRTCRWCSWPTATALDGFVPDGRADSTLALERGHRATWSTPGSVGQPRDGDPRAAFAIYDQADDVALSSSRRGPTTRIDGGAAPQSSIARAAGEPREPPRHQAANGQASPRRAFEVEFELGLQSALPASRSSAPPQLRRERVRAPRASRGSSRSRSPTSSTAGMKMKCADVMLGKSISARARRCARAG